MIELPNTFKLRRHCYEDSITASITDRITEKFMILASNHS